MRVLLFFAALQIGPAEFNALLDRLAEGWSQGDARKAADCFTEDALYVEPPDRQVYRGREELYRFFGGDAGRPGAMSMTWRNRVFDDQLQIGFGEFTFAYGSQVHGSVFIELRDWKNPRLAGVLVRIGASVRGVRRRERVLARGNEFRKREASGEARIGME